MKKSIGADTLAYPTPVWCVGSYDNEGRPNVMTIAWGGICCSKPPAVTVSLRKATYTYGCIMARRAYTISVPSAKYIAEADYFGIVSGKGTNKFHDTGLTPVRSDKVDAPYVAEFPLVLECNVLHTYEIGLHTQFIGQIVDIKADEEILDDKGLPLMERGAPFVFAPGIREYRALGEAVGRAFDIGKAFGSPG
ncbi:MAG: flavin reductase family protein [Desulfobacterales bacterium]|jgi:flavin reductase (DIM6/NTAB) family NADH-FMN oxidoreductase RutF